MSRSVLVILALMLIIAGVAVWFASDRSAESQSEVVPATGQPDAVQADQQKSAAVSKKPVANTAEPEVEEADPFENQAIQAQLLQVADLYQETIKYPHFSQPIFNPDSLEPIEPFVGTEVDTPFPTDQGGEPVRLQAAVDRYQYFSGEQIQARVKIVGAPSDTFIQVQASLANATGVRSQARLLNPVDESLSHFTGSFDTGSIPSASLSTEMLLTVEVSIGEEQLFTTVPFRFSSASAVLTGLGNAAPENEYLIIPLQYSIFEAGYYFVRSVLQDAETGAPLVQLQAEGRLNQGNGVLQLKAHVEALKAMNSEGPYVLSRIKTYRGAEDGEPFDRPGSSVQASYPVPGYNFDQYDNVPYVDELANERLAFLQSAGAVQEEESEE